MRCNTRADTSCGRRRDAGSTPRRGWIRGVRVRLARGAQLARVARRRPGSPTLGAQPTRVLWWRAVSRFSCCVHFGEVGTLASEQVPERLVSIGLLGAEEVDALLGHAARGSLKGWTARNLTAAAGSAGRAACCSHPATILLWIRVLLPLMPVFLQAKQGSKLQNKPRGQ